MTADNQMCLCSTNCMPPGPPVWSPFSLVALVKVICYFICYFIIIIIIIIFWKGLGEGIISLLQTSSTWLAKKEHQQPDSDKHICVTLCKSKLSSHTKENTSLGSLDNNEDTRLVWTIWVIIVLYSYTTLQLKI